jgi:hypothetical protein
MLRSLRSQAAPLPGTLAVFALLALAAARVAPPALEAPLPAALAATVSAPRPVATTDRRLADAMRHRSVRTSDETRASADAVLGANARRVDAVTATEPAAVARLAAEFRTPVASLRDERNRLGVSWGELAIAHTLAASARPAPSVEALARARDSGADWSAIATALQLDLGGCITAVRAEARVAAGTATPDGHVPPIHAEPWTATD